MRVALAITGAVLTILAFLCLLSTFANENPNNFIGYSFAVGFFCAGALFIAAAVENYRGGWRFAIGNILLIPIFLIVGFVYHDYSNYDTGKLIISIGVVWIFIIASAILFRLGHRHQKNQCLLLPSEPIKAAMPPEEHSTETADEKPVVFAPLIKTWRLCLLLVFSCNFYVLFLIYRIVKEQGLICKKNLNPIANAVGIFFPLVDFYVFYKIAKNTAALAQKAGIAFKFNPAALTCLVISTSAPFFLPSFPSFLIPLFIPFAAAPWLILNRQMDRLRLVHTGGGLETASGFSWKQRGVFLLGIPLMALMIFGSKVQFAHFNGDRLTSGQTVTGTTPIYQISIKDEDWRQVARGTLDKDTDLELMGKTIKQWVVVRVVPNQGQLLEAYAARRREIIAATWKDFNVTETRTLDSGERLTPVSLADYSGKTMPSAATESMFVALIVTPEYAIEAIGRSMENNQKEAEASVKAVVKSLRLTARENKP